MMPADPRPILRDIPADGAYKRADEEQVRLLREVLQEMYEAQLRKPPPAPSADED